MSINNKTNASVFIPHLGCPHKCSFCNKDAITEAEKSVSSSAVESVSAILDGHARSLKRRGMTAEIAYFGGTFTALDRDYREELLRVADEYIEKYPDIFTGIRCSTRPDYIDAEVLSQLRAHRVTAIELGAQSMDDEVLSANDRGHTAEDVRKAVYLIREFMGIGLGLQMMTGLYGDTFKKSLYTCDEIIKLNPDTVRIYPTVVFEGTRLYEMGYTPFSEEETVELCAEIYGRFTRNNIKVIRIGLNYSGNVIGERSISRYYYNTMLKFMRESGSAKFRIYTDRRNISKISGHRRENALKLEALGFTYKIKEKANTELEIHAL